MKRFLSAFVSLCIILSFSLSVFSQSKESTAETQAKNTQKEETNADTSASLSAVSGFKVLRADEKSITLTWDAYDDASSYIVSMYDEKTKEYAEVAMTKDTSCKINSLSAGKAYNFKITALVIQDSVKYTPKGKPLSAVTAPQSVKGVRTDSIEKDSITLSWNKSKGAARYDVWKYDTEKDKYTLCESTNKTQAAVKLLEENTLYLFKVRAVATAKDAKAYGKFSAVHSEFTDKDGDAATKAQAAKLYNDTINTLKNNKNMTVQYKKSMSASALSCSNDSILRTVKNIVSLFNGVKKETVTFSGGTSAEGSVNEFIQPYSKRAILRACDILKFSVIKKGSEKRVKIVLKGDSGGAHNNRAVVGARVEKVSTSPIRIKKLTQNYDGCELIMVFKSGKLQKLHIDCDVEVDAKCRVSTLGFETTVGYEMKETYIFK